MKPTLKLKARIEMESVALSLNRWKHSEILWFSRVTSSLLYNFFKLWVSLRWKPPWVNHQLFRTQNFSFLSVLIYKTLLWGKVWTFLQTDPILTLWYHWTDDIQNYIVNCCYCYSLLNSVLGLFTTTWLEVKRHYSQGTARHPSHHLLSPKANIVTTSTARGMLKRRRRTHTHIVFWKQNLSLLPEDGEICKTPF